MYLQNKKPCSCLRKQEQVEHQKFIFSWDIIFMSMSDWLCLNTLKAQHRVQWVATPTVLVYPLRLASRGWSSPAILPPQDWTGNLTVNSPTLQPLNQVADEISCLMCLYIAQDVPGLQENSKIKNLNFVNIGIRTQYLGVVCVNTNALTAWLQAP
jgi:hypothetical protein